MKISKNYITEKELFALRQLMSSFFVNPLKKMHKKLKTRGTA